MQPFEKREFLHLEIEGLKLLGVLHLPRASDDSIAAPYPAVLICHGLAGNKCGKGRLYVRLSQELAKMGIASLRFDFRGCGDSEGELVDSSIDHQVQDALMGLNYLATHPEIDASRIGIFGRSFGGAISVLAAAAYGNIQSLVLWAPVYDGSQWVELWKELHTKRFSPAEVQQMMTFNGQLIGSSLVQQLFALNLEAPMQTLCSVPLLHVHSEKDRIVSIQHAEKYAKVREKSSVTKFIRLQESDHDFTHSAEREDSLQATLEWFHSTLDPDCTFKGSNQGLCPITHKTQ